MNYIVSKIPSPQPSPARGEGVFSLLIKKLRINQTDAEKKIWSKIKNRQLQGFKFKRQVRIENYIVDFICFEKRLIVELDGGQHNDNQKDLTRDTFLQSQGFHVLRFWNNDVLQNTDVVLNEILLTLSPCGRGQGEG
jgi:very-short-patch-repair endonuclease